MFPVSSFGVNPLPEKLRFKLKRGLSGAANGVVVWHTTGRGIVVCDDKSMRVVFCFGGWQPESVVSRCVFLSNRRRVYCCAAPRRHERISERMCGGYFGDDELADVSSLDTARQLQHELSEYSVAAMCHGYCELFVVTVTDLVDALSSFPQEDTLFRRVATLRMAALSAATAQAPCDDNAVQASAIRDVLSGGEDDDLDLLGSARCGYDHDDCRRPQASVRVLGSSKKRGSAVSLDSVSAADCETPVHTFRIAECDDEDGNPGTFSAKFIASSVQHTTAAAAANSDGRLGSAAPDRDGRLSIETVHTDASDNDCAATRTRMLPLHQRKLSKKSAPHPDTRKPSRALTELSAGAASSASATSSTKQKPGPTAQTSLQPTADSNMKAWGVLRQMVIAGKIASPVNAHKSFVQSPGGKVAPAPLPSGEASPGGILDRKISRGVSVDRDDSVAAVRPAGAFMARMKSTPLPECSDVHSNASTDSDNSPLSAGTLEFPVFSPTYRRPTAVSPLRRVVPPPQQQPSTAAPKAVVMPRSDSQDAVGDLTAKSSARFTLGTVGTGTERSSLATLSHRDGAKKLTHHGGSTALLFKNMRSSSSLKGHSMLSQGRKHVTVSHLLQSRLGQKAASLHRVDSGSSSSRSPTAHVQRNHLDERMTLLESNARALQEQTAATNRLLQTVLAKLDTLTKSEGPLCE